MVCISTVHLVKNRFTLSFYNCVQLQYSIIHVVLYKKKNICRSDVSSWMSNLFDTQSHPAPFFSQKFDKTQHNLFLYMNVLNIVLFYLMQHWLHISLNLVPNCRSPQPWSLIFLWELCFYQRLLVKLWERYFPYDPSFILF